jgi:hypothetical protein
MSGSVTASGSPVSTDEVTGPGSVDLAALVIDDRPTPDSGYRRDDWPTWADLDGDGCDTRAEVLMASSRTPAQVDPHGCTVVAGVWTSAYDGAVTPRASDLDIDHVVPLENAHDSGGWRWTPEQRRQFANDPSNLVAVLASSNRSKGSRGPEAWRPPDRSSWCVVASRWVAVKVAYGLTATTVERDALGDMLATCRPG